MASMFDRYNRPTGYGQPTVFKDQPKPEEPPGQPGRPPSNPNLQTALQPPQQNLNQPSSPSLTENLQRRYSSPMHSNDQGPGPVSGYNPMQLSQQQPAARSASQPTPFSNPMTQAAVNAAPAAIAGQQPAPFKSPGYGQHRGALEGFDNAKMDKGHDSPKYVYAEYASHYTPQQLATDPAARAELEAKLEADPRGYFKDVSWTGNKFDRLKVNGPLHQKFEGYSEFDTVRGAGNGGEAHQWGAINPNGQQQQAPGLTNYAQYAQQMASPEATSVEDSDDFLQRLLAQLRQQQG